MRLRLFRIELTRSSAGRAGASDRSRIPGHCQCRDAALTRASGSGHCEAARQATVKCHWQCSGRGRRRGRGNLKSRFDSGLLHHPSPGSESLATRLTQTLSPSQSHDRSRPPVTLARAGTQAPAALSSFHWQLRAWRPFQVYTGSSGLGVCGTVQVTLTLAHWLPRPALSAVA